ncbi:PREDICTED: uncharacterized protein LOC109588718 [Amphimedon queenslandica]|uniref:Fibronectin type-III domain-containing protein n=1 Tax=Amphimedon queenslandica TaxID=400682 RepID=A0AAN0JTG0_AMPQE|nr:PREDICTED: uncharacterized protein LOC109588718 [Amphimedon queenslandica]|eukprot:XP_019860395.1 PREDICTED: uncharacterized protein LOC109588718 [Amphimedon queenslandica]
MLLNTVALLLGVELILLYSGLADGVITNFQCTDGPVCAGDRIECRCTTNTGTLEWFISYSPVEPLKWNPIPVVSFFKNRTKPEGYYGYNFTFNTTYTGLNTSILTFNLNHSESVLIECANGNEIDKMNTTVTDSGYYAKAPTNITTTFTITGVILQWEDTENNCNSTEYNVTLNGTSTGVLIYNTSNTVIFINFNKLNIAETYTYTVRGWNGQQSNISRSFTLAPVKVTSVHINTTNTTDPCKNNSCCANVTLNIILESPDTGLKHPSQYHNISYNSITGNIPITYEIIEYGETVWTGSGFKYNEAYCFTVTPMNYFSTGEPISNDTTTEYQCQSPGNGGDNGDDKLRSNIGLIVGLVIGVASIIAIII